MSSIETQIRQGIAALHLPVLPEALQPTVTRLALYLQLLERWNRTYNLTAVRHPADQVTRHLLDSLSIWPWICGSRVVDIGSGAGLPGIPLALVCPDRHFTLIDSHRKCTHFLMQVVIELNLSHVAVVRHRVEHYQPSQPFDCIVARAFASLKQLVQLAGHLCTPAGRLLAMKGHRPDTELAELPTAWHVVGVHPLTVPGLDAQRHLVELAKVNEDPNTTSK